MNKLSVKKTTLSLVLSLLYSLLGISYCVIYKTTLFLLLGSAVGIVFVLIYLQTHQDVFSITQETIFLPPEKEDAHKTTLRKKKIIKEEKIQSQEYYIPFSYTVPSQPSQKKTVTFPGKKLLVFALCVLTLSILDTSMSFFTSFLGWQALLFWGQTWVYWKSSM